MSSMSPSRLELALVFALCSIAAFAHPDAAHAQGAMTNGSNHTGAISGAGELDQWTFTATQGDAITVAIGEIGDASEFLPWIRVIAPSSAQIGSASSYRAAHVDVTAPQTGTYTVIVASSDGGQDGTGSYRLTLAKTPGAFVVDGDDEGGPMINGDNHTGSIHQGDIDLWSFTANQGDTLTLAIGEVGDVGEFLPWIRLRGPNGAQLMSSSSYRAAHIDATAPQTGTYTVVVTTSDGGWDGVGNYLLTLARTPAAFVVPGDDEGGPMTNGQNHEGAIHQGDVDQWTFTANQGDAITLAIGEVGNVGEFLPWIRLRGPNGEQLMSSSSYQAAHIDATAPQTGTYTVLVTTSDGGWDGMGSYLLTLAKTPGAFVVPDGDHGGPMANGANHAGAIHVGDLDQWTFTANQGDAITLAIGEVGDVGEFLPWIRLRGPNGEQLGSSSSYRAAHINAVATQTGTYTVLVTTSDGGWDGTGNYLLTLAKTPGAFTDDEGGEMTNGANHTGSIHRGDIDQWRFQANQGDALTIAIGEIGDVGEFLPWIRIRGPNGEELGASSGYRAAQVTVTAPQTGTYTVLVTTSDGGADGTGTYHLTLARTPAAFVVPTDDEGGAMVSGVEHTGSIFRGDLDQWTFTTGQGSAIKISIGEIGNVGQFLPWIRLRGPNGQQLQSAAGYESAQININAPQTGTYTVLVSSNDGSTEGAGSYRLQAIYQPRPDPPTGANLQITKDGTLTDNGNTLTYTLTAINHGPVAAADVVVTDNLPGGVTFVSCTATGGICGGSGNARSISYASLPAGQSRTITIVTTRISPAGVAIQNTATIASSTTDPVPGNNSATHVITGEIDTDGDGMEDEWEENTGLNPLSAVGDDGSGGDPDNDGLLNSQEHADNTHPRGFFTRYLAEGAVNGFFDVRLALLNVSNKPAKLLRRYLPAVGDPVWTFQTLQPGVRLTLTRDSLAGLLSPDFSTVVESDEPIVLDRTMTWGGGYGSHAESGVPSPATTWYLAEGSTSGDFALFYLLQNPNINATTVTVRYLLPFGQAPVFRTYTLEGRARLTIPVDDQGPELASTDVSAVITAPVPIIVERAMYKSTPSQLFAAGHGSAGVTAPARNWFLAEGATGPFFDCFILLANPNDTAAAVTVDYLLSDGTTRSKSYEVPANGRFTIWVDNEQFPEGSGVRPLDNVAVSSTVASNVPIIVERTMWWPSPAFTSDFWTEAHNSPGATTTATKWALAEGEVGGPEGAETYILIANTSAFAGTARVTLYFEDGTNAQRDFDLQPRSRFNVNTSVDFPAAVGKRFGAVIESLGSPAAEIVVERAMYTSAGGKLWSAGTNALGAPILTGSTGSTGANAPATEEGRGVNKP